MRKRELLIISTVLIALIGCGKKDEQTIEPSPAKKMFIPNSSGQVTKEQFDLWNSANTPLNALTNDYIELLKTEDEIEKDLYSREYIQKNDSICKASGLTGGHKEYRWISRQLGKAINAPIISGE
jgi:hypothetical protein